MARSESQLARRRTLARGRDDTSSPEDAHHVVHLADIMLLYGGNDSQSSKSRKVIYQVVLIGLMWVLLGRQGEVEGAGLRRYRQTTVYRALGYREKVEQETFGESYSRWRRINNNITEYTITTATVYC